MNPILLEFDKKVSIQKSLKKSLNGFHLKQMTLNFVNEIDQCMISLSHLKCVFKLVYLN